MHARYPGQLGLEMKHGLESGIARAQISEGAPEQRKKLRLVMVGLGANFDQLDEIRRGLRPAKIFPDSTKWIPKRDFRQRM